MSALTMIRSIAKSALTLTMNVELIFINKNFYTNFIQIISEDESDTWMSLVFFNTFVYERLFRRMVTNFANHTIKFS